MSLSQLIYTSTCADKMTPQLAYSVSLKSVTVCQQLGLTGRVFANDITAFAMTEGPTDLVKQYFLAVQADTLVETILLHVEREIEEREFEDYAVLLNLKESFDESPHIRKLTDQTLEESLPAKPSSKLRIMVEVFKQEVLAE